MTKLNKFKQFTAANLIGCVVAAFTFGNYYLALGIFLYNVALMAIVIHSEGVSK